MVAATQQSLFAHDVSGSATTVVPDLVRRLAAGDLLEVYTRFKGTQSPAALVVAAEVPDDRFSAFLVTAEENDYQEVLVELGEPMYFWMSTSEDEAGDEDGSVGLTAVLGNGKYPLDLKGIPWLRGMALTKAKSDLSNIYAKVYPSTVHHPTYSTVGSFSVRFLFAAGVVGFRVAQWEGLPGGGLGAGWLAICLGASVLLSAYLCL